MNESKGINRIRDFILYGDTDKESYEAIKPRIWEYNRKMGMIFGSVAVVLVFAMYTLAKSQEALISSRPVYATGILCSIVLIVVSAFAKKIPALSYVSAYMAVSVFLLYGIALGTLTRPDDMTVTFMVLLIFSPLVFVDRPITVACVLIFYDIIYILMAMKTKNSAIVVTDLTDAVIYGILSIISETVVNRSKIRGYVFEHYLNLMNDIDQLTGINNRNCYEKKLPKYKNQYNDSISCVYMDVNGLHELNNTEGHIAGDKVLCSVGGTIREFFGKKDIYRIGGDEFVAFALDLPEMEVKKKLSDMMQEISENGYQVAVGYVYASGGKTDINELIISAEKKMIKNKEAFYKEKERNAR